MATVNRKYPIAFFASTTFRVSVDVEQDVHCRFALDLSIGNSVFATNLIYGSAVATLNLFGIGSLNVRPASFAYIRIYIADTHIITVPDAGISTKIKS
jgi:hypothetical protein